MEKKCGDTNYEEVNMDMSDSDGSDNEMFSCKQEYKSFKQHFDEKTTKAKTSSEYGGDCGESFSEYGGGEETKVSVVGSKFGHNVTAGFVAAGKEEKKELRGNPMREKGSDHDVGRNLEERDHSSNGKSRQGERIEGKAVSYNSKYSRDRSKSRDRRSR